MSKQNKAGELEHAKKILHHPEFYWNAGTPAGERGSKRRIDWIIQDAGIGPGKVVLEAGCGTGYFSRDLIQTGAVMRCVDISPDLLEKAARRCGMTAEFKVCDLEQMPYPDHYFDAVVGIRILHHLDMDAAIREIKRVLKPGGRIAFCEPNMLNPQIAVQKNIPWIKKAMGDTPDETAFFKWRLRKFLARSGFTNIRIQPFDFLHPWIHPRLVDAADRAGRFLERIPVLREIAGSLQISAVRA